MISMDKKDTKSPIPSTMRLVSIVEGTSVDGPGLRTSVYFAGCTHHCAGCHNQQTWDPNGGYEITIADLTEKIHQAGATGVTFSGGDPMFQAPALALLAPELINLGHTLWCYTGYTYEEVLKSPEMKAVLPFLQVLVDGRYVEALRDTHNLIFRGSSNQRLIDVQQSLASNQPVIWNPDIDVIF